jgi:hypothetical protein
VASSPTKPGTKKLSEVARKVVAPDGIVSTGWPAVEAVCNERLGVTFDPWQQGAGRLILAKRADGNLASMIGGVGMSLPRQVGKTHLIGALVFALCILRPGLLVIWSAHHARTHGETFLAMIGFAKRSKVKPYIEQVFKGSGDEEIRFHNGSRILFGARERGFGRGVAGVDMIVSDEAQIMSEKALDAQLATMNTSRFGLAIYVGTPPRPDDPSDGFTRMRSEAWAGTLRDGAWIEFGADPDAKPSDRAQWAKANPSYPRRTPAESILRLQRKLTPESFLREGLGVWTETGKVPRLFDLAAWRKVQDRRSQPGPRLAMAVHFTPDRSAAAVAVASRRRDGKVHVEVIQHEQGVAWALPYVVDRASRHKVAAVTLAGGMAAGHLAADLEKVRGFRASSGADTKKACARLLDLVASGDVVVRPHPDLDAAVTVARKSSTRSAEWVFDAPAVDGAAPDLSPLYAAALAVWMVGGKRSGRTDAELLGTAY